MTTGSSSWIRRRKRLAIYARDGHRCVYCLGEEGLTLDHLRARTHGGTNHERNLVTACHRCNSLRRELTIRRWYRFLRTTYDVNTRTMAKRIARLVRKPLA